MDYSGRVAIITGASSGIGAALSSELARRGALVGMIARREAELREVRERISSEGGKAEFAVADVSDRARLGEAVSELTAELGPPQLLVANAGLARPTDFEPINIDDQELMIRVNLLGVMYAIEAVLPGMLERGTGHIAGVSSLAAYRAFPWSGAYCASKSAVNAYLEAMRIQLGGTGVRVTTVCPGFVDTAMIAERKESLVGVWTPEKAARKIVDALEREKKVYNFPWLTTRLVKWSRWLPDWFIRRQLREE